LRAPTTGEGGAVRERHGSPRLVDGWCAARLCSGGVYVSAFLARAE